MSPEALARRARWVLLGSVAVTIALFKLPIAQYFLYPVMAFAVSVHELGHGIGALLMGGSFHDFKMWSGGGGLSGVASTSTDGSMASGFVLAGGLCGPAVAGALLFAVGRDPKWARRGLLALGGFLALAVLLWARNGLALVVLGGYAALFLVVALKTSPQIAQLALVFVATQLALSVYVGGNYLFMQEAATGGGTIPSDTQQMANQLGGTYWFWGAICAAVSAAALGAGAWMFVRGTGKPRVPRAAPPITGAAAKAAPIKPARPAV
jgi:hypothetical protein